MSEEKEAEVQEKSEEPAPAKNGNRRRLVWAIMKLVGAIGLLTVAVNSYLDLEKENQRLSRQNAMMLQALGSKLNRLSEEVSYMRGRFDSLHPSHEAAGMPTRPIARPLMDHPRPEPDAMEDEPAALGVAASEIEDEADEVEESPAPLELEAYEDVPTSFEGLQQLQVQVQERLKR